MGLLRLPIPMETNSDFPVIQYADDTLIILEGDTRQLLFLKSVINTFSEAIGLKVNWKKSMMLPINIPKASLDFLEKNLWMLQGIISIYLLGAATGINKTNNSRLSAPHEQV